jgi:hypothetical protein
MLVWRVTRVDRDLQGLERFDVGHHHRGSQGHSRIIRLPNHHGDHARLGLRAHSAWQVLEEESAVKVITRCGSVELALSEGIYRKDIAIYADGMDAAHIEYQPLECDKLMRSFPSSDWTNQWLC